MFRRKVEDEEKAVQPVLNPNQRQFMEDEKRYREKLQMLDISSGVVFTFQTEVTQCLLPNLD